MEFKNFFSMLKNRISNDVDVPYFMRELIEMITNVPEEKWDSPKDPATRLTKESTLRSYAKRGLSQKLCRSIIYDLSPENFIDSVNSRPEAARKLLAEDYAPINPSADEDNIAELLAECFVDILKITAGVLPLAELEKKKLQQQEQALHNKYGSFLLNEANRSCPFPGCGHTLIVSNNGQTQDSYSVALIDKKKAPEINNLLALCPRCYAIYSIDDNAKICKQLVGIKKLLFNHQRNVQLLENATLEKGIVGVISQIKKLKEKDLADASLDPQKINNKIDPAESFALYITVKNYVTTYYVKLKEILMNADKRGQIDYEEIQDQMKGMYRRLKKKGMSKDEIFNEMSQRIHKASLQEEVFCQIVVAYFVQKCEVFDAITE